MTKNRSRFLFTILIQNLYVTNRYNIFNICSVTGQTWIFMIFDKIHGYHFLSQFANLSDFIVETVSPQIDKTILPTTCHQYLNMILNL